MDWFSEILGFVIVLLVFFVPLLQKFLRRKIKESPQEEEMEEEEIEPEYEEQEPSPSPMPFPVTDRLVQSGYTLHSNLEERSLKTRVAPKFDDTVVSEAFDVPKKQAKAPVAHPLLQKFEGKSALKKMVVLSTIFGSPKGVAPSDDHP